MSIFHSRYIASSFETHRAIWRDTSGAQKHARVTGLLPVRTNPGSRHGEGIISPDHIRGRDSSTVVFPSSNGVGVLGAGAFPESSSATVCLISRRLRGQDGEGGVYGEGAKDTFVSYSAWRVRNAERVDDHWNIGELEMMTPGGESVNGHIDRVLFSYNYGGTDLVRNHSFVRAYSCVSAQARMCMRA